MTDSERGKSIYTSEDLRDFIWEIRRGRETLTDVLERLIKDAGIWETYVAFLARRGKEPGKPKEPIEVKPKEPAKKKVAKEQAKEPVKEPGIDQIDGPIKPVQPVPPVATPVQSASPTPAPVRPSSPSPAPAPAPQAAPTSPPKVTSPLGELAKAPAQGVAQQKVEPGKVAAGIPAGRIPGQATQKVEPVKVTIGIPTSPQPPPKAPGASPSPAPQPIVGEKKEPQKPLIPPVKKEEQKPPEKKEPVKDPDAEQ